VGFQGAGAKFKFEETRFNFGSITQGDVITHEYTFVNEGNEPLIISEAKVACTCSKISFPSQPIMPGEKSAIKLVYDSKGAIGRQDRNITIISNAVNSPFELHFKSNVKKKD